MECKNHSLRFAVGRCKRCHIPVCAECKLQVTEGIFCSEDCVEQFRSFQERMVQYGTTRSRFSVLGFLKSMIISAVLIVIIYFALYFWLGTGEPSEMWTQLVKQLKAMF